MDRFSLQPRAGSAAIYANVAIIRAYHASRGEAEQRDEIITTIFSHPSNALHDVVRLGVRNSSLFRRFALRMDDLFYGKVPETRKPASWMQAGADAALDLSNGGSDPPTL